MLWKNKPAVQIIEVIKYVIIVGVAGFEPAAP